MRIRSCLAPPALAGADGLTTSAPSRNCHCRRQKIHQGLMGPSRWVVFFFFFFFEGPDRSTLGRVSTGAAWLRHPWRESKGAVPHGERALQREWGPTRRMPHSIFFTQQGPRHSTAQPRQGQSGTPDSHWLRAAGGLPRRGSVHLVPAGEKKNGQYPASFAGPAKRGQKGRRCGLAAGATPAHHGGTRISLAPWPVSQAASGARHRAGGYPGGEQRLLRRWRPGECLTRPRAFTSYGGSPYPFGWLKAALTS